MKMRCLLLILANCYIYYYYYEVYIYCMIYIAMLNTVITKLLPVITPVI